MRREQGRRRIYRSRRLRRRRSAFVLCVLAALACVVLAAGQSRGRDRVTYDRRAAAAYADTWALRGNPAYWSSPDNDCADFVSQCLAAGGLRPLAGADGGEWHENGTEFPTVAWVNCDAQKHALSAAGRDHTSYIAHTTQSLPGDWAAGDIVYLGAVVDGKTEWQHVIVCAGRDHGEWVYDSHTTAYLRRPLETWYPAHFTRIRFCHIADWTSYGG